MHPFGDLSAYLDSALSSEARASVQAHLDTCALCRTRLAELRGTARLIAGLPIPVPSRSLVPRVSIPFWLAPLRTFSTLASGAAIFLFLATAVLSTFPRATSAGAAPAAAPAPNAVSAPQASSGARADSATAGGAAATAGGAAATAGPESFNVAAPSPAPAPNTDRAVRSTQTDNAEKVGRQGAAASDSTALMADGPIRLNSGEPAPSPLQSPWLWLVLGVAFAALSLILGRRLRSA